MRKLLISLCVLGICWVLSGSRHASLISKQERQSLKNKINSFGVHPDRLGPHECHKYALALFYIHPGDTAIDAGAWMGEFAEFYSKLTGQNGKVIAYEASPYIFKRLDDRLGQVSNILLRERALTAHSGETVQMKVFPNSPLQQCSSIDQRVWEEIDRVQNQTTLFKFLFKQSP